MECNEYAFRAHIGYEEGKPILCKAPNSRYTVDQHVTNGSTIATKFISLSTEICVPALKFPNSKESSEDRKRTSVVLVDFEKLKSLQQQQEEKYDGEKYIYDYRSQEDMEQVRLRGSKTCMNADREIVVNREIPPECCKEIPPIMVDILLALQTDLEVDIEKYPEKKEVLKTREAIYKNMLDMIMSGDTKIIEEGITKVQFNDIEKKFISLYYEEMMTMQDVAKEMFGDREEGLFIVSAILSGIVKKELRMIDLYKIANLKCDNTKGYDAELELRTDIMEKYIAPYAWAKSIYNSNKGKMVREFVEPRFGETIHTTATEQEGAKTIFDVCAIAVGKTQSLCFPIDIKYEIQDGRVIGIAPKYVIYSRKRQRV